jgi:hypothetical protein
MTTEGAQDRRDIPYHLRPPLIKRPRKHYHYPTTTEAQARAAQRMALGLEPAGQDPIGPGGPPT